MDFRPFGILLALATLATPAFAGEIDEVVGHAAMAEADELDDDALGRRPRRRGTRTKVTRTRTPKGSRTTVTRSTRAAPRPAPRTARPAPASRPVAVAGGRTVRPAPPPRVVRPAPRVVGARPVPRTVVVRRVTPAHGVFVYGPPPRHHHHYHGNRVSVQTTHMPQRAVERDNSFALGIKGGSMLSGTQNGDLYSDGGLGLLARYRPAEAVGLQLDVTHFAGVSYDGPIIESRHQTQAAGSLGLFAFPWTRVSPYVLGGVTYNALQANQELTGEGRSTFSDFGHGLTGLHAGAGIELALGRSIALDFEGRYVGWLDRTSTDPVGALQGTAGLLVHF